MLSVAISSQQLLLARAKGEKRGKFYFSDIGKNNLSFTVLFQDQRAHLKITIDDCFIVLYQRFALNKGYRRYPDMLSTVSESRFLCCM